jgi:hypothetical protein
MANIEKKPYSEFSYNTQRMIGAIDVGIDGGPLPITVFNIDATVEEVVDAMKYIIDTGWMGNDDIYAAFIGYVNQHGEYETGVEFADDEKDYWYGQVNGYYEILDDLPRIVGKPKTFEDKSKESKMGFRYYVHDGDVLLKFPSGKIITKSEWDAYQAVAKGK